MSNVTWRYIIVLKNCLYLFNRLFFFLLLLLFWNHSGILYDILFQTFKIYLKLLFSIMKNIFFQTAKALGYLKMCT